MPEKISPADLKKQAQKLIQQGKMPSLEELLPAVAYTRKKYSKQIVSARKEKD